MTLLHPRLRTLDRYADAAGQGDPRLAAHLLRCARCRRAVDHVRALRDAARSAPVPPPAADALERILARRAAGDRVILPVAAVRGRANLPRRGALAAAAVALLVVSAALLLRPHELEAGRSELMLAPANPRPGQTVRVEYRPGARLEHESVVVLRAQERVADAGQVDGARVVARLVRGRSGTFTGSFRLPDPVVFARFAVEDTAHGRVDANPAWNAVVADAAGRPSLEGLTEQYQALSRIDMLAARRAAERAVSLYPDAPGAWLRLFWASASLAPQAQADSLRRVHRLQVRRLAALSRPGSHDLAELVFYASAVDDSAQAAAARARLLARDSTSADAFQQRVIVVLGRHGGHHARELAELERLWGQGGGVSRQLLFTGVQVARAGNDPAAVLRWGDRMSAALPYTAAYATRSALAYPQIRAEAMERVRRLVRRFLAPRDDDRPLEMAAPEFRAMYRGAAASFLGELGKALAAEGRMAAARDTLELAIADSWDPELFRSVAQARLALGDTAGAVAASARVAADPGTAAAYGDSVLARFGSRVARGDWRAQVAAARLRMRAQVMARAVDRRVRGPVRVADASGVLHDLDPASRKPTLVVFWSRFCPAALAQLGPLQELSGRLRRGGTRVVTISFDEPSPEALAFLASHHYTFPVVYDVDRSAQRAFDNAATPRFQVLDRAGRIRFESYAIDDVLRQVTVLRDPGEAAGDVAARNEGGS
ncbi:MAG TPA: TlpA disulfide reductase family protein [Longimicrobium sp.]|nr:TlpA disulfide reductase family protein [Longimicrobium sp.]